MDQVIYIYNIYIYNINAICNMKHFIASCFPVTIMGMQLATGRGDMGYDQLGVSKKGYATIDGKSLEQL